MKSMSVLFSVAAIALCASVASAQSNWVGVTGGAGLPTGDYSNAAGTGWGLGATGTHMLDKQWGIGGDLGYHSWGGSDQANAAAIQNVIAGPPSTMMLLDTRTRMRRCSCLLCSPVDLGV